MCSYHSRNEEAGEEIPEAEEKRHENRSYLVARSESYEHHAVEGEVDEAHEHVVVEPHELGCFPLKTNHGVEKKAVQECLDRDVDCFNGYLPRIERSRHDLVSCKKK